jgi:hypothetical protein
MAAVMRQPFSARIGCNDYCKISTNAIVHAVFRVVKSRESLSLLSGWNVPAFELD